MAQPENKKCKHPNDVSMFGSKKINVDADRKQKEYEAAHALFKCCMFCPCMFVTHRDWLSHMREFGYDARYHREKWENLCRQRKKTD